MVPQRAPGGSHATGGHAATVVVVDDEPDIADLIGWLLERAGYRVLCATSGADAIRLLSYAEVDLVVTDFAMPGMNGAELLRILCQQLDMAHIPVLVVSAFPEEVVRQTCKDIVAFLPKPFKTTELLAAVSQALERADR
jgi:CheY-like chemotaxis protein